MDRAPGPVPRHESRLTLRDAGFLAPDPAWAVGKYALLGVHACRVDGRTELRPVMRRIPFQWMGVHYQDCDDQPYLLLHNSGGGMIEGDSSACQIVADAGTRLLVTTTGANKYYKCEEGGRVDERLEVLLDEDCVFEYLPDEAIPYARTRANRLLDVDANPRARLFVSDILCAGRIAFERGELFAFDSLVSETSLRIGGRRVWLDRLRADTTSTVADLRALWGGCAVMGTVLAYAPDMPGEVVDDLSAELARMADIHAAATLLDGNIVCVRILADAVWCIHEAVQAAWARLRPIVAAKPARRINKP